MIDAQELELVHLTEAGDLIRALPLDVFSSFQSPHLVLVDDRVWVTEPDMTAVFAVDAATGEPSGDRIELARPDGTRVDKPIGIAANADGQLWIPDSTAGAIILVTN
jgi:streptogramin lyase